MSASPKLPTVEEMESYFKQVECAAIVMDGIVGDSELKTDFKRFNITMNNILGVDRKRCYTSEHRYDFPE